MAVKHASKSSRTRELAVIHVAKKQLGLDDDAYREMLHAVAGVGSAADLDAAGRKKVLRHMKAAGYAPARPQGARTRRPGRPADKCFTDWRIGRMLKKIEAQLADMGLEWEYAHAIARKMHRVSRLEWCDYKQIHAVVSALAYHQRRRNQP